MSVIVVFVIGVAAIAGWWLSHQRLMSKPWLEGGVVGDYAGGRAPSSQPAKIGLGVFLAVVGALFALFISAYVMRSDLVDWRPIPIPPLLWFNTAVLVLSSVLLQWASVAARRGDRDAMTTGLLAAGVSAVVFLVGQLLAWRQLYTAGYGVAANPANSFFYLITAVHGLHLMGGLVALGRAITKLWRGIAVMRLRLSVELCAIYWHFLLAVWVIVLALLTGWMIDFFDICRRLLT